MTTPKRYKSNKGRDSDKRYAGVYVHVHVAKSLSASTAEGSQKHVTIARPDQTLERE